MLAAFLEECCIEDPNAKTSRREIWSAYAGWADRTKERYPLSRNQLYDRLRERGYEDSASRQQGCSVRGFIGLGPATSGPT